MDENKKNRFLKGLWGKNKEDNSTQDQQLQEHEQNQDVQRQQSADPVVIETISTEKNRMDLAYRLYCRWCRYENRKPVEQLFSKWMLAPVSEGVQFDTDETAAYGEEFRQQLLLTADQVLNQLEEAEQKAIQLEENAGQQELVSVQEQVKAPPDIDAAVYIQVPKGNMIALLCAFPPFGAGGKLDKTVINEALESAGVTYGINQELLDQITEENLFFQIFPIAVGVTPITGKDGSIIEHIPREEILSFEEDAEGRVNYKDLNLFRNIRKGDLICDIIAPEEGKDGTNVRGETVKAANGKAPKVPAGSHTIISPDGTQLLADFDGYISFQAGKFRIEDQLVINGNVDMSVGNQDFLGDIIVHGDVISGFQLKATGNILVKGIVEGAVLTAGENIEIGDGMNGSNRGELHAGGSIRSAFLENVKVYAAGNVNAQSMISCQVHCDGSIYVDQGIGVLIGGTITVGKSITAKIIGSKAYRKTELFLGMMPETRTEKEEKTAELETVKETRSLLQKNIHFLQTSKSLTQEKASVLEQLIEQEDLYEKIEKRLNAEIDRLNEMTTDYKNCFVRGDTVYPPTKVTIGGQSYSLETASTNCRFYLSVEGNVVLGVN